MSALYLATSLGHEAAARRLVLAGARVDLYDPYGRFDALIMAAERGCEELVNDLLIGGAKPNTRGVHGLTALHIAAKSGFEGVVSALLTRGADKNALSDDGVSPLNKAAKAGHLAIVNALLAAGADLEIRDEDGLPPLVEAAGAGNLAVVNILLTAGADVESRGGGFTALSRAARYGHIGVLKAILGHGADVNAADEGAGYGYTALHVAASCDEVGAIDVLVEAGADMEQNSAGGGMPLCCSAGIIDKCKAIRALLRHGSDPEVRDHQGNTPLHITCRIQRVGVDKTVDLLLRSGADETTVNNDGKTPAQILELPRRWGRCCSEEMERARKLLARAPNDRAWRRRCWLVMLRSRSSRGRTAGYENVGISGHVANADDGRGDCGGWRMAKSESDGGCEGGVVAKAGNACAVGFGGEGGSLGAVVASLIGLELEGVFRTIVGFL